ncbi:hypothetical protein L3Q70_08910 [Pseudoalteromonas sp. CF6-2]|nr:hypothetical protein [Pseudoalteromonas arabiensis]UJX24163.1 hypothetical protein L3Q70_08910 [Pseudoalteromonas sp. CF6-2]
MDLAATYSQTNSLTFDIFEEHLHKAIDKPTVNIVRYVLGLQEARN